MLRRTSKSYSNPEIIVINPKENNGSLSSEQINEAKEFLLTFGKYAGRKLGEVPRSYVKYMHDLLDESDVEIKHYFRVVRDNP